MADDFFDFHPVSRITVGVIGRPGQRTFFLQASQGPRTITLKMEKEQVNALAQGIDQILEELENKEIRRTAADERPPSADLALIEPVEPIFAVGQIGLAFDEQSDMMVLIVQAYAEEQQEPERARFWASRGQMHALADHARHVVEGGRPICPLCNRPIDPEGHFCPPSNGHSTKVTEA